MKMEIEVSDETIAYEIAIAISGRARQIHENPHDKFEDVALELRDISQDLREEHRDAEYDYEA